MEILNDSDIVEATQLSINTTDNNIVDATPEAKSKKRRKNNLKQRESLETLDKCLKLIDKYSIQDTAVGSPHYNKPFIYFDIKEIKQLSNKKTVLKHNNVHLVGFYRFDSKFGQILADTQISDFLQLDLKLTESKPVEENLVSVYGSVELKEHYPILIVYFFRAENAGYCNQYKDSLKFTRNFVPRCYFEVITM